MPRDGGPSETPTFRTLPAFRLHVLNRLTERQAEATYRRLFDLTLPECRVIGVTGGMGPAAQGVICREAELEKAHGSRLVARLVGRGLLERRADPADGRAAVLALTAAGRRVHRAMHAAAVARNEEWLAPLSAEQRRAMLGAIEVLIAAMREEDAA